MAAIKKLSTKALYLEFGKNKFDGDVNDAIEKYLKETTYTSNKNLDRKGNQKIVFKDFFIADRNMILKNCFFMGDNLYIYFALFFNEYIKDPIIAIEIRNILGEPFAHIINKDDCFNIDKGDFGKEINIAVQIPEIYFTPSVYLVSLWVGENNTECCDYIEDCLSLEIIQGDKLNRNTAYPKHVKVYQKTSWSYFDK